MLNWSKKVRKNQAGGITSESRTAQVPGWGQASIHPHIHHPGEVFLDCPGLGVDMHPLGPLTLDEAVQPAEEALAQVLDRYAAACRDGLAALRGERSTH